MLTTLILQMVCATSLRQSTSQPATQASYEHRWKESFEVFKYEFFIDPDHERPAKVPAKIRNIFVQAKEQLKTSIAAEEKRNARRREERSRNFPERGDSDSTRERKQATRKRLAQEIRKSETLTANMKQYLAKPGMQPLPDICLPALNRLVVGEIGTVPRATVFQVAGPGEAIVTIENKHAWMMGVDSSKIADNQQITANGLFEVPGTKMYQTTSGSTRTIPVIEPLHTEPYLTGLTENQFEAMLDDLGMTRDGFVRLVIWAKRKDPRNFNELVLERLVPRAKTRPFGGGRKA